MYALLISHGVRCFWDVTVDPNQELGSRIDQIYRNAPISVLLVGHETRFHPDGQLDYVRNECKTALRSGNRVVLLQAQPAGPCSERTVEIVEQLQLMVDRGSGVVGPIISIDDGGRALLSNIK